MALSLHEIEALFLAKGDRTYAGDSVTQLEHALQTARHAETSHAGDALIVAALLHDLGHLLDDRSSAGNSYTPTLAGIDDRHEYVVIPRLVGLFPEAVLAPIRGHVEAKRFLCAMGDTLLGGTRSGADYLAQLSADSQRSLLLQGGVFTREQAQQFVAQPFAADALRVRVWDDAAKVEGVQTPSLDHYFAIVRRVTLRRA